MLDRQVARLSQDPEESPHSENEPEISFSDTFWECRGDLDQGADKPRPGRGFQEPVCVT
jgi:hypothetical protein